MSVQPDTALQVSEKAREESKASGTAPLTAEAESFAKEIDKELAQKLKEDPVQITHEDAARVQSAEHHALGHRPPHDSVAAQTQANFHKAADVVQKKLENDPPSVTGEDAKHIMSVEHKALGHMPPKDSISAAVQRTASANERSSDGIAIRTHAPVTRDRRESIAGSGQSNITREKNFEITAQEMMAKLENHPEDITGDDAKHMRRADTRAHGGTEKGSLTAQVQSEAAKHENDAKRKDSKTDTPEEVSKTDDGVELSAPKVEATKAEAATGGD
ncbi:hypothetical protein UCRNP2_8010 [Neofusicoccum parvum UCRNP2]|uniref:SMP domain-containing protein n=1 Tax=Botryosphaeria parva (strain UCR-NP2) TaxID=1287680 RepID=R1GAP9_BOTPV|nr:hypothetical protein UCRNP2_8010 [Neofusicoccum parvum UCRNP2]